MTTLKVIKATPFDTNGTKGTTYVCALKGRVLIVNTLPFVDEPADALKYDDKAKTLVINVKIEVVKKPYFDVATGESLNGLSVLPAFGMDIAEV